VLRKILGPTGKEMTVDCRKLIIKELDDLYFSPDITWVNK